MSTIEKKIIKCIRCRCYRDDEMFLNDKGRRLKSCSICRERNIRYISKIIKCKHCEFESNRYFMKKHVKLCCISPS